MMTTVRAQILEKLTSAEAGLVAAQRHVRDLEERMAQAQRLLEQAQHLRSQDMEENARLEARISVLEMVRHAARAYHIEIGAAELERRALDLALQNADVKPAPTEPPQDAQRGAGAIVQEPVSDSTPKRLGANDGRNAD